MTETEVTPRARLTFASGYGLLGVMLAAAAHASTFTGDPLRPEHQLFGTCTSESSRSSIS